MWVTCEGSSQGDGGAHVYLEVQGMGLQPGTNYSILPVRAVMDGQNTKYDKSQLNCNSSKTTVAYRG